MANLTFRALLLCSLVLGVGCSKKSPQAVEKAAIEKKPTLQARVIEDDFKILDVVLLDLLGFDDFGEFGRGKDDTKIVLDTMTVGAGGIIISEAQFNQEANPEKGWSVSLELQDDLRSRNPDKPISLAGYKSPSRRILVEDLGALISSGGIRKEDAYNKYRFQNTPLPNVSRFVIAWLPGYSKDGSTAVFRAFFGPSGHGATVTYKLTKKDGKWMVVWRFVALYK